MASITFYAVQKIILHKQVRPPFFLFWGFESVGHRCLLEVPLIHDSKCSIQLNDSTAQLQKSVLLRNLLLRGKATHPRQEEDLALERRRSRSLELESNLSQARRTHSRITQPPAHTLEFFH